MAMTKAPEPTSEEDGGNTIETYKSGLTIIKSVEGYISSVYGNTMIMYYPKDQLEVTYERDADQKLVEVKREENITQGEHNNNIQQYKELKQEAKSEVELMESVMTNSAKLTARKSQEVKKTDESTPTDAEIKALVKLQSVVRRRQARKHKKFIRDAKELLKQSGKEVWGFDQANTPEEQELKKLIEKTKLTSKDWGQLEELVNTLQRSNESKGAPPPKPPARIRQEVKKTDEALDDGSTKSQPAFLSDIKNLKKQPHLRTGLVSKVNELRQQYFNRQQEDGFDSDQSILNSLETLEKKGGQVTQDDIDAHETLISEPSEKEQGLFRSAMLEKARPTTGSSSIPDRGDDDDWDDDVNDQPVEAVTETPKEDAKVIFKQKINKFQDTKQRLFEDELHGKYYTHEYTTINQWAKDQEEGVESSDYDKKYKEFISKVSKIQDAVRDIKYLTNKEREDVINKALGDEEKLGFDKIKKGPKLTDNSIVKLKVMRGKVVKAATNKEVKPSNKSVIKQGLKRRFHNESTTWLDKIKEELERMEKGDDSFFGDDGMSWNDIKSGVKDIINEMKKNKMPENIVKDLNQLLNDKKYTAFIKQNDITEILGLVQESGISKENKQKAASSLEALFSKGGPAQSKKTIETNEINDVPDPTAIEKAVDPEIENKAAVKLQSVVRRRQARKQRKLISDAKELLKQSGAAELGSESPNTTKEKQLKQLIEKFNKQQKLTKSEETTLKKLVENIQEYSKSAKVESLPKIDKGILLILKTRLNTITQFVRGGGGFGRVELSGGKINTETFTIVDKLLGENKISLLQVYSEVISQDGGTLARFKSYLDKKSKKVKSDPDWNKQLEELYNKLPTESKNRDMRLLREKIKSLIPPEKKEQKKLTPDETFNPVKDLFKNDEPTIKLLDEISKEEYKDLTSVNKLRDKIIRYNKMMRFQQSRMTDQELKVQKFPEYPEYPEFILGNDHTKVFTPLLDAVDAEIKEVKLQSQSEQLINAIKTGSKDDALKLLELKGVREKADTTTNLVLKMACSKGMPEVAMKLLEQPEVSKNAHVNNNAALIRACGKGLSEVSLKLLEQPQVSKNAHAENNYALNLACKNGMQKVVKKLLGQKEVLKGVPNLLAGMEQGDAKDNLQGAFDKTKKQAGLKLCLDEFANVIDVILAKEIDFDGVEVNVNTLYNIKKNSLVDPNENIDPNENKNDSLSKARREFGKIVKEMRDLSKKGYLDTPDDIEQLMDKIAGLEKQFKIITEDVIEIVHFSGVLGNLTYEVNQPTTTKGNMDVFTMQPFQKLQLFCKDLSKQIAKCFDMQQRIKFAFEVIAKNGSDELNMAQTEVEMEKHKNDKKEFYYSTGPSRGKRYKDVLGEKSMIEGKQPVKTVGDLINIGNLYIAGYGGKDSKESAKACYQKASKILKDINVDELSPENREETEKNVEKLRAELDQLNRKISEVESNDNPDVTPEMVKSFKKVDYIPKEQFTKGENYVESDGELDLTRGLYFASKGTRDGYVTLINKNSDLLGIKEINKEDIYKDSPAANVSKKTGWFSSKEVYQGKGKGHRAALLSKMNEIKELIGSEDFNPRIHLLEGLAIAQVIKDLSEEDKQDFAKKYRSLERYSTKKGYRENLSGKIMLSSLKALSQEVYGNPDKLKDASPLDIATAVQTSQTSIQDRDLKLDESKITNDATAEELYAVGVLCFTESSKLTDSRFDKAKSKMEEKGEKYFRQALKKEKDDKSDIGYRTKRILGTGERKPKIISGSELDDRVREVDNYIFEPHGEDARSLYDDIVSGKTFAEEINDKSIKKQIDEVKKTIYSYSNSKITKILEDYCNKIKQRPFEAMAELDKKMPELKKEISDLKVDGEKQGHTDIIKELRNLGHKHIIASLQKDIPFLLRMYKGGIELSETDKSRINKKKMKKKIRLLQGKPYHDNIKAIQGMLNQDITPQERVLLYRYVLQEPPELSKNQMCCVLLESIFQENAESQHGTCPTYVALPPKDVYSKFLTKPQSMWDKFKNIFKVFSKKTGDNAENDMTVLDEHLSEKGDNVKSQAVSP
ncbi:MAG TPA: hypothetical protein QF353_00975, partial [Gammaproteobacteria bacterium]|nr:hypothetical protein [Gammaproteobacteria bacterium]